MTSDGSAGPRHAGVPGPEDDGTRAVGWVIQASMLGSLVAFVAALLGNVHVLVAGVVVLFSGCFAVGVLAFREAKRLGQPATRSLRRGVRAAFGWLYHYH